MFRVLKNLYKDAKNIKDKKRKRRVYSCPQLYARRNLRGRGFYGRQLRAVGKG